MDVSRNYRVLQLCQLAERGATVGLDESAEELILREGFCEESGARNLERAMDRLLGTPITAALLRGKLTTEQKFQVRAKERNLELTQKSADAKAAEIPDKWS